MPHERVCQRDGGEGRDRRGQVRAAPADNRYEQASHPQRQAIAEVKGGDVYPHGGASIGARIAFRHQSHPGHVDADETRARQRPQQRARHGVARDQREQGIRHGGQRGAD